MAISSKINNSSSQCFDEFVYLIQVKHSRVTLYAAAFFVIETKNRSKILLLHKRPLCNCLIDTESKTNKSTHMTFFEGATSIPITVPNKQKRFVYEQ